jgi:hypothetical protein
VPWLFGAPTDQRTIVVNRAGRRIGDESFFPSMVPTLRQFVTATHHYAKLPCF